MPKCKTCGFLNQSNGKGNFICSIQKLKHPTSPGLYIKNPNSDACYSYQSISVNQTKDKK